MQYWERDPRAAVDMHQHDKLIHLGVKNYHFGDDFDGFAGVFGMVRGWFYMALGEAPCALKLVSKPPQQI